MRQSPGQQRTSDTLFRMTEIFLITAIGSEVVAMLANLPGMP